jgi:two-component system response regulator CpxR
VIEKALSSHETFAPDLSVCRAQIGGENYFMGGCLSDKLLPEALVGHGLRPHRDAFIARRESGEDNMKPVSVLLVDDDVELCSSLKRLLTMEGFDVTAVHDADSGVQQGLKDKYDLVILDVMLPGGDGRKVLRRVRVGSRVPVIMLTARGDEADRIAGLEGGADDYLPKPFNTRELVARMRAVLRRRTESPLPEILRIGDIEIHRNNRKVLRGGERIDLTGAEFDVLVLLVRSAGKVLSRDEIAEMALGRPIGALDRTIDNHVSNLRKKLGPQIRGTERIRNVRGAGYIYAGETDWGGL